MRCERYRTRIVAIAQPQATQLAQGRAIRKPQELRQIQAGRLVCSTEISFSVRASTNLVRNIAQVLSQGKQYSVLRAPNSERFFSLVLEPAELIQNASKSALRFSQRAYSPQNDPGTLSATMPPCACLGSSHTAERPATRRRTRLPPFSARSNWEPNSSKQTCI
jgi:hypothetical protein